MPVPGGRCGPSKSKQEGWSRLFRTDRYGRCGDDVTLVSPSFLKSINGSPVRHYYYYYLSVISKWLPPTANKRGMRSRVKSVSHSQAWEGVCVAYIFNIYSIWISIIITTYTCIYTYRNLPYPNSLDGPINKRRGPAPSGTDRTATAWSLLLP